MVKKSLNFRDFPWDEPNEYLIFDTVDAGIGENQWYRQEFDIYEEIDGILRIKLFQKILTTKLEVCMKTPEQLYRHGRHI